MEESFSLLYPEGFDENSIQSGGVSDSLVNTLGADTLLNFMRSALRFKPDQKNITEFFTTEPEVIQYRLDVIDDLIHHPGIYGVIKELLPQIENLRELQMVRQDDVGDTMQCLYSAAEIELYTDCIDRLFDSFKGQRDTLVSAGLKSFASRIIDIYDNEEYSVLKVEKEKILQSVRNIKSITVGVNLDAQLKPVEAGIVSINSQAFRSGNIIDRILRMDLSHDGFTCLGPLCTTSRGMPAQQTQAFAMAVNNTLDSVLKFSVKNWKPVIRRYILVKSAFLSRLADEIRFLVGAVELIQKLRSLGLSVCKPKVAAMSDRSFNIKGLYNAATALEMSKQSQNARVTIIPNDLEFDDSGRIFIFTGPNQGGKTVFTQAVGIAQMLFQFGLFVPAVSAEISPADGIFAHFQLGDSSALTKGRLGEECAMMKGFFKQLTRCSMVLMDESFSSTSAMEGTYIAGEVLMALRAAGCRAIFATHFHDLAQNIERLNDGATGESRIDSLVAGIQSADGMSTRSYKVIREKPGGDSYARDIAEKYGITFDSLIEELKERRVIQV